MINCLTGIKPTGTPHLGNYLGAIRPALEMAKNPSFRSFYFIAEYHALTSVHDSKLMKQYIHEVAATWLACGLDPNQVIFYRQGDVPEIFELSWILSCFTSKGLMNRAHAYKAVVQDNEQAGRSDPDAGVSMGLYGYPVLMSADILLFESKFVPVGKDQVQHVEIARDVAGAINHAYKQKLLVLPEAKIQETTAVLPGLDGRKMSKSYNNTIPLFAEAKKLQKLLNGIKTDSTPPEVPKDPDTSYLFQVYKEFGTPEQIEAYRQKFLNGISWGQAKADLFEVVNGVIAPMRDRYQALMQNPAEIDRVLAEGAKKARAVAIPVMDRLRTAMGLV